MKASNIILALLSLIGVTSACCKHYGLSRCCGKGKCNIFCCNCDGGCKPKSECCKDTCFAGCYNSGGYKGNCIRWCTHRCKSKRAVEEDLTLCSNGTTASDEEMFRAVDVNGVGYFTYEQFLAYENVTHDESAKSRFNEYDRNGDGVITLDEMR
ncbi:hypothetical protein CC78DRAFT_538896 [Lojkania enalia]|uniref:EF-hand domain-containing protein n=1 Tax=Lojkania enalia TaxID=147567 RepID=A0A9P4NBT1_9PLEO|nr:hypothetical protein CC78DRAFT_538896 [Didymosphaeria enalia]